MEFIFSISILVFSLYILLMIYKNQHKKTKDTIISTKDIVIIKEDIFWMRALYVISEILNLVYIEDTIRIAVIVFKVLFLNGDCIPAVFEIVHLLIVLYIVEIILYTIANKKYLHIQCNKDK